jgi:hypothetical protein
MELKIDAICRYTVNGRVIAIRPVGMDVVKLIDGVDDTFTIAEKELRLLQPQFPMSGES